MTLWQHTSGEQARTVPNSTEDRRLAASADWHRPGEQQPAEPKRKAAGGTG